MVFMIAFNACVCLANDFRKWFSSKHNQVPCYFYLIQTGTCWRGASETSKDKRKDSFQGPFMVDDEGIGAEVGCVS